MPYNNPLTLQEVQNLSLNNPLHPRDGSPAEIYMPEGYLLIAPPSQNGPIRYRLLDAAHVKTGIMDPNRLGTGAVGDGNLYLADDGTWKAVSSGGGSQNLQQVTDLGNVTTNTIDTAGTKSDYFLLDTLATPTPQQGMLFWDEDRSTVGLQMNGVEARLGQDNFWYVKNQTGSPIPKGTAVMAVGALGASSRILVAPMIADGSVEAKYFLGITAEEILDGEDGFVTNIGKIRGIDTSVYGTQAGQILYCDPANPGGFTITQPAAPNLNIAAAFTVDYKSNGTLAVRALPGYELNELHDVYINTPSTGQLLRYNTNRWENWTPNFLTTVPTLDQVTTAGNTTANGISIGSLAVDTNLIYTDTVNNRVGIGTSSPAKTLHVSTNNNDTTMGVGVSNDNVGGRAGLSFNLPNNTNEYYSIGVDNDRVFKIANANNLTTNTRMSFTPTGNVLIGTTTDAGYKLDVNGTLRTVNDAYFATTSGNVGIGTSSPSKKLHLNVSNVDDGFILSKSGSPNTIFRVTMDGVNDRGEIFLFYHGNTIFAIRPQSNASYINTGNNFGIGTTSPTSKLHVKGSGTTSATTAFRVENSDATASLVVRDDGNVGIGTTSPSQKLEVQGTIKSVTQGFQYQGWRSDSEQVFAIAYTGYTAIFRGWDGIEFQTNGIGTYERAMLIASTGNVMIGTTTDAGYKLDVNGNVKVSGTIEAVGGTSSDWNTAYSWGDHSTQGYITGTTGFTGTFTVPTNPPGQQNLDIQNGLIVNVF